MKGPSKKIANQSTNLLQKRIKLFAKKHHLFVEKAIDLVELSVQQLEERNIFGVFVWNQVEKISERQQYRRVTIW
jgi:hypothetical protein